jgi:hypothetical protein
MYAERETFGPASLSMLATRSSERVKDVFAFILPLYYQSRILASYPCLPDGRRERLVADEGNAQFHAIALDLYHGKITYGEANKRTQDCVNSRREKLIPIVQRYQAELAAQKAADKAEADRQQQAAAQMAAQQRSEYIAQAQAQAPQEQANRAQRLQLFTNYMNSVQAQQPLQQQMFAPRPTYNTNCYTAANSTNCTTH